MLNNIPLILFIIIENIILFLFFNWLDKKLTEKRKKEQLEFYEKYEKPFIEYIKKIYEK